MYTPPPSDQGSTPDLDQLRQSSPSDTRIRELEARLTAHLKLLRKQRRPTRDINAELAESFSTLDRVALFVTQHAGQFGFFIIIFVWTAGWLGWNLLAPRSLRFDPAPAFVLWLFISNMLQILLMPLIMVGQNLLNRHSELRSENDFEINQKAEQEVEVILLHLDHQAALIEHQQEMILEILHRLDAMQSSSVTVSPARPAFGVTEGDGN